MRVTGAVALVLAAGKSERMPGDMDKLMLHVGGRPVLAYCLEAFDRSRVVDAVVLVCNPVQRKRYQRFVQSMKLSVPLILVDGGSHRQLSGSLLWNRSGIPDFCPDWVCHAGNPPHCADLSTGGSYRPESCYGYHIRYIDFAVR